MRGTAVLVEAWRATVHERARDEAVIERNGLSTSFQELDASARDVIDALPAGGPGQIIALHLPNGARWMEHYLALLLSGRILLPIDPELSPEAARRLARTHRAAVLVDEAGLHPLPNAKNGPCGTHLIKLTSGSTGAPKALHFGQGEMLADAQHIARGMGLSARDRHLAVVPFGHSYGLGNLVLPLIVQGAILVCPGSHLPQAVFDCVLQQAATVLPLVPPLVRGLASLPGEERLPASVRLVISAGARLDPAVARNFARRHGLPVHNFYGASETGGIAFDVDGTATESGRSVGRPLPGVEVRIVGKRIQVHSAAVLRPDPGSGGRAAYELADTGEWTPQGELVLRARTDDAVKIGGRRISLNEVEGVLRTLPGVEDAVVLALQTGRAEARLAAMVATRADLPAVREMARKMIPDWQRPRIWRTCRQLPVSGRGKIDREAVRRALRGSADD